MGMPGGMEWILIAFVKTDKADEIEDKKAETSVNTEDSKKV